MLLVLLLGAGIIAAIVYRDQLDVSALEDWVKGAGGAGPLVFMGIYILGTLFFLPGSVLTLAGGALFGPVFGTFYNLTAATIGAMISFVIARYLAHGWVEQKTAGRLKQLKQGVEAEGWKFVAFVRLVPLFPFNLLNYALGLTRIKFSHYSIATYICMLPGAIAYTYLGYAGREAIAGGEGLVQKIMLALALLAMVSFLPSLIGRLRRGQVIEVTTLKERQQANNDTLILDVRTQAEFGGNEGHIGNAINIPVGELSHRLEELNSHIDKPVAIVCHTDKRSAKAARILTKHGFSQVVIVKNGMTAWKAAGFDIVMI